MVSHFTLKKELFGTKNLCRDLDESDLTVREQEMLRSGPYRFLPKTDSAGRYILFSRPCKYHYDQPREEVRTWVPICVPLGVLDSF